MANEALKIFISHSSKDKAFVRLLMHELDRQKIPYWSDRNLELGSRWLEEIESAIRRALVFVLVISPGFETSPSALLEAGVAVGRARESGAIIVPVLLPGASLPPVLRGYQGVRADSTNVEAVAAQIRDIVSRIESKVIPSYKQLSVYIFSSMDVVAERELVMRVIEEVNAKVGSHEGLRLEAASWEADSQPMKPINSQAHVEEALRGVDVFLVLFSARIGATAQELSGIEKELSLFLANSRRTGHPQVLCYMKTAPVKLTSVEDVDQFRKVLELRDKLRTDRLIYEFETLDDLERSVRGHLTNIIQSAGR